MSDNIIIDSYDKTLLMHCINNYIEKIEFVLRNSKYYFMDNFLIESFKNDLIRLKKLQIQLFSIDIKELEEGKQCE